MTGPRDATRRHLSLRGLGRALGVISLAALGAAAPSCSLADAIVPPCDGEYAGLCGASCLDDNGCAAGLYCGASGCTADCTPDGFECGLSAACSASGRCGGDTGAGFGSPNGTASGCADVDVKFERVTPTVVLLIDQSGSMDAKFGSGTRWTVLKSALMNQQTGFVKALEDDVRFGLSLYTSDNGFQGGVCPRLAQVSTALGNYGAIKAKYDAAVLGDDTPTGDSIAVVAAQLAKVDAPGPKLIVLATDGEPDTCQVPDPQNGQASSLAAAEAAYAQGIKTVIVSVGDEVGLGHLQDMANAGAGFPVKGGDKAPYYQVLDQQSLIAAFDKIIHGVRSCVFTLSGEVTGDASQGTVTLDGQKLALDDPDGWKLNSASEIELLGDACREIQEGEHTLSVTFPCGAVITDAH